MTAVNAPGRPAPRADRVRNRAKILHAARSAFCAHGTAAPLDPIARAAGVGNATLYRHFPDRDALVRGVCLAAAERIAAQGRSALAEEADPFEAVRRFAVGAAREGIGLLCLMVPERAWLADAELLAARQGVDDVALQAVQRAQRAGRMRTDVGPGDLMVALGQLTRPLPGHVHGGRAELLLERHCRLLLAGMESTAGGELPGPPVSLSDIRH
ncbi:TetR/AcrR family transcriptional regulator [Streptomyces sp. NPDC048659]|uniref:TetR/AcrR family transcriptional regulator n=1 Tax=Streptomyces sp. NPDC048659 TaxID=3155489 RepID=UPI0034243B8D